MVSRGPGNETGWTNNQGVYNVTITSFSRAPRGHGRGGQPQRGQGMTEYIIIVALIAVSAITVYSLFGQTLRAQTAGLAREMAGQSAAPQIQQAGTASQSAVTDANQQKGLGNYNNTVGGGGGQ